MGGVDLGGLEALLLNGLAAGGGAVLAGLDDLGGEGLLGGVGEALGDGGLLGGLGLVEVDLDDLCRVRRRDGRSCRERTAGSAVVEAIC